MPPPSAMCRTRHETLIVTHRLGLSALAICTRDLSPTEAALTATFEQAAGKPFLRNLS